MKILECISADNKLSREGKMLKFKKNPEAVSYILSSYMLCHALATFLVKTLVPCSEITYVKEANYYIKYV